MYKELGFCLAALLLAQVGGMPATDRNLSQQTTSRSSNRAILEAVLKDIEQLTLALPNDGGTFYVPEEWDACAKKIFKIGMQVLQRENENNEEIGNILRNIRNIWNEEKQDISVENCQRLEVETPQFLKRLRDFVKFLIATEEH